MIGSDRSDPSRSKWKWDDSGNGFTTAVTRSSRPSPVEKGPSDGILVAEIPPRGRLRQDHRVGIPERGARISRDEGHREDPEERFVGEKDAVFTEVAVLEAEGQSFPPEADGRLDLREFPEEGRAERDVDERALPAVVPEPGIPQRP